MSIDNSNINPKSPHYESIFAYSSADEAVVNKVANNFTEFLNYCVLNTSKICASNQGIVDFLNGFETLN
jgi:hypothetical protein